MASKIPLLYLTLMFASASAYSQTTTQSSYWVRYQNQLYFSPNLYWNTEVDNRRFVSPDAQLQLIIHSRLHRKLGAFDLAGGITFSWAYAQRPENSIKHPTFEIRPVLEGSYESVGKRFSLQHRLRLDNRFIEEDRFEGLRQDYQYTARLRYRIQAKIPIIKKEKTGSVSARLANEVMVNHRENFYDQNRIHATLDVAVSRSLTLEGGYIFINQRRFGREEYFHRHVLRLSISHRIHVYQ
ncbi:MAG TPA: DUF2490 domain-containing protein [Chryseosolibacter sp.]|nr:DUF2490 domain-containing protein [Chryseosolibacter sp.]